MVRESAQSRRIQIEISAADQKLEEEMQCREEASTPGNFARFAKFRKAAKILMLLLLTFFVLFFISSKFVPM